MLSPFDAEADTSALIANRSRRYRIPAIWTNRVGTVYEGGASWMPNLGTAGSVDSNGTITASSTPGVEEIVHTTIQY